ncbi:hypothetical protein AG1IA_01512 [Rhizoctonia solani AG-1 IA]|uniref:Hydrophobin domain-containing protein n=1 Tax=Thanatephorus cucumeris (strain AG1-IA) TaxID=983506 RepID=L8X2B2_THACA|nr:hypothetical protein AG1IA_01512 [Rhizoctonia solani AG-1 IA]
MKLIAFPAVLLLVASGAGARPQEDTRYYQCFSFTNDRTRPSYHKLRFPTYPFHNSIPYSQTSNKYSPSAYNDRGPNFRTYHGPTDHFTHCISNILGRELCCLGLADEQCCYGPMRASQGTRLGRFGCRNGHICVNAGRAVKLALK